MTTAITFKDNIAGSATNDDTLLMADATVPANTLTNLAILTIGTAGPIVIHGIVVTPASASPGAIDIIQLDGATTKNLLAVGTWKFNQTTSFYIPINAFIQENYTLKVRTTAGSPTCAISPHFGRTL